MVVVVAASFSKETRENNGLLPELCITFHLRYISFALHLNILPCHNEMHVT